MKTFSMKQKIVWEDSGAKQSASQRYEASNKFGRSDKLWT